MRRLYSAVCAWLEADAEARSGEPMPQGDVLTSAELDGRHEPTEMHQQHRPEPEYRAGLNNDHRRTR